MADEQISLSSLIFIVVISGLAIRYFFFGGSPSSQTIARPSGRDAASAVRAREAAVERIQQMFPQVDRRTVLWDLQRTGGSVQATTERILSGRVETPPITFQPLPPPASPTLSSQAPIAKAATKPAEPDLITRYNLQSKVSQSDDETADGKKGWSSNRDERQSALQRRRDEMIIAARKKMEEKIRAEKEAGKSS
ncbi:putative CUE domain-containing protein [Seiridium cardinale]|uniref:CUE domain-containing protein n=1 Tax=Seiridium cardinale TaxID=138064 RepID=A0ABR2XLY2_9PEZI